MVNEQTSDFLKQHSARKQVVLVGMETHICVQQTFFDLKEKGMTYLNQDMMYFCQQIA